MKTHTCDLMWRGEPGQVAKPDRERGIRTKILSSPSGFLSCCTFCPQCVEGKSQMCVGGGGDTGKAGGSTVFV